MTDQADKDAGPGASKGERIAKVLARAGVASRREVERMIAARRVALDGRVLASPACLIESLAGVTVDGKPVTTAAAPRLWRYHKPPGLITTHRDPAGRATVFDHLPGHLPRVVSVGRLDLNSEGLLLLTNDGALARWLELPANGVLRRYRVRVHGRVDPAALAALAEGTIVDGIVYEPIEARVESSAASNSWLEMALKEGKNREIRRVLASLGLEVNRLIRIAHGPWTLGSLARGAVAEVPTRALYGALGNYFRDKAPSVAEGHRKAPDMSRWAKAKPKPGPSRDKRRRKAAPERP